MLLPKKKKKSTYRPNFLFVLPMQQNFYSSWPKKNIFFIGHIEPYICGYFHSCDWNQLPTLLTHEDGAFKEAVLILRVNDVIPLPQYVKH